MTKKRIVNGLLFGVIERVELLHSYSYVMYLPFIKFQPDKITVMFGENIIFISYKTCLLKGAVINLVIHIGFYMTVMPQEMRIRNISFYSQ